MATKNDLTFTELNTALGGTALTFDAATSDIKVSLKAITGTSYSALTDAGVLKAIKKLRDGAYTAQETANDTITDPAEQLSTFGATVNNGYLATEGGVVFSNTDRFVNAVDFDNVTGSNT